MDSQRKHIDFQKLFYREETIVKKCGTIDSAMRSLESENPESLQQDPTDIVFHVGTNDTDNNDAKQNVEKLLTLADRAAKKYPRTQIYISELPPRGDELWERAMETNSILRHERMPKNVRLISNENLTQQHLYDAKHLSYRYEEDDSERVSGTMRFAGNIYKAVMNTVPSIAALLVSRLRNSDIYH